MQELGGRHPAFAFDSSLSLQHGRLLGKSVIGTASLIPILLDVQGSGVAGL